MCPKVKAPQGFLESRTFPHVSSMHTPDGKVTVRLPSVSIHLGHLTCLLAISISRLFRRHVSHHPRNSIETSKGSFPVHQFLDLFKANLSQEIRRGCPYRALDVLVRFSGDNFLCQTGIQRHGKTLYYTWRLVPLRLKKLRVLEELRDELRG